MNGKTAGSVLAMLLLVMAGYVDAAEPLPVIYAASEEDGPIVESQQHYIDNQAYLEAFEQRRRQGVLQPASGTSITVIRSGGSRLRPRVNDCRCGGRLSRR